MFGPVGSPCSTWVDCTLVLDSEPDNGIAQIGIAAESIPDVQVLTYRVAQVFGIIPTRELQFAFKLCDGTRE